MFKEYNLSDTTVFVVTGEKGNYTGLLVLRDKPFFPMTRQYFKTLNEVDEYIRQLKGV